MSRVKNIVIALLGASVISFGILAGCSRNNSMSTLQGEVKIDGSSTVFPISEAMAEEFTRDYPEVKVSVGESGTGGGMKKFVNKEIDICDASRRIKNEEIQQAKANGIEYIELKVAFDGLSVVINKKNTWAMDMTTEELNSMWRADSKVRTWSDIRDGWPNEPIKFYSPGTASGTFEYFTEAINRKAKSARQDATSSEDDNVLVTGVAGDKNSIAYMGFSYYEENSEKLNVIKVNGIGPSYQTIKDGTYKPLSRPLFVYVNKASMEKSEVREFVNFYLNQAKALVSEVGYVPLPDEEYTGQLEKIK